MCHQPIVDWAKGKDYWQLVRSSFVGHTHQFRTVAKLLLHSLWWRQLVQLPLLGYFSFLPTDRDQLRMQKYVNLQQTFIEPLNGDEWLLLITGLKKTPQTSANVGLGGRETHFKNCKSVLIVCIDQVVCIVGKISFSSRNQNFFGKYFLRKFYNFVKTKVSFVTESS